MNAEVFRMNVLMLAVSLEMKKKSINGWIHIL